MFTINNRQIKAMSARLSRRFEDAMVLHLSTFFPERCAELGPEGVEESITYAMKRAALYNIASERDVCKFLNLMYVYGREFDVDPALPWASEILNDKSLGRSSVKMHLLMKAADGTLEPPLETVTVPTEEEIEAAILAEAANSIDTTGTGAATPRGENDGKPQH